MKYRLTLIPSAKLQLDSAAKWWAENRSVDQAARWLEGFQLALRSLQVDPARFPVANENHLVDVEVRQLLYGLGGKATHRAVFEVRGDEIIVYAIRHLAQSDLTPEDFE